MLDGKLASGLEKTRRASLHVLALGKCKTFSFLGGLLFLSPHSLHDSLHDERYEGLHLAISTKTVTLLGCRDEGRLGCQCTSAGLQLLQPLGADLALPGT
jgi:hypothetical protein